MVEWRNGGKGLTNWSGSCMIFVFLYEVNNTKEPKQERNGNGHEREKTSA